MICPNKSITFRESILSKAFPILSYLKNNSCSIGELYINTKDIYTEINEFILALDILYILDSIELDDESKEVVYVKANNM